MTEAPAPCQLVESIQHYSHFYYASVTFSEVLFSGYERWRRKGGRREGGEEIKAT